MYWVLQALEKSKLFEHVAGGEELPPPPVGTIGPPPPGTIGLPMPGTWASDATAVATRIAAMMMPMVLIGRT